MENLKNLRKELFADGRFTNAGFEKLREVIYNDEGMTKEKGEFLFELKDSMGKDRLTKEFGDLFINALSTLLIGDEDSPGEIDEEEAKWLRAKIQTKGFFDTIDEALLSNLRKKAINFPPILNHKSQLIRQFENVLFFSRYLTILAVIGAALSALALFVKGSVVVLVGIKDFFTTFSLLTIHDYESLIEIFVSSVDIYLFAMVLIIFSMGIYELFISKIDPVEQTVDSRPSWLQIKSIDDLKSSLGKVILMVLIVSFFKHALVIPYNNATDLLYLAIGVALVALSLYIAHSSHSKHKK